MPFQDRPLGFCRQTLQSRGLTELYLKMGSFRDPKAS
jgi:hypothetical protein